MSTDFTKDFDRESQLRVIAALRVNQMTFDPGYVLVWFLAQLRYEKLVQELNHVKPTHEK